VSNHYISISIISILEFDTNGAGQSPRDLSMFEFVFYDLREARKFDFISSRDPKMFVFFILLLIDVERREKM